MSKLASLFDPKRIEKQNKAFYKLSNRKKRLAIAEDVLLQLKAKKYQATPGCYVDIDANLFKSNDEEKDLQKVLLTESPNCSVCGLGAAFVSLSRLGDKVSIIDSEMDNIHQTLADIFGYHQVVLIECAFENQNFQIDEHISDEEKVACDNFYKKYIGDDDKRLRAIFKNIIKNDGTFKP